MRRALPRVDGKHIHAAHAALHARHLLVDVLQAAGEAERGEFGPLLGPALPVVRAPECGPRRAVFGVRVEGVPGRDERGEGEG